MILLLDFDGKLLHFESLVLRPFVKLEVFFEPLFQLHFQKLLIDFPLSHRMLWHIQLPLEAHEYEHPEGFDLLSLEFL